jgi:hypothetical protein
MKYRTATFEADLRDEIAVAIARGFGEMQAIVGRPEAQGWRRSRPNEMAHAGGQVLICFIMNARIRFSFMSLNIND